MHKAHTQNTKTKQKGVAAKQGKSAKPATLAVEKSCAEGTGYVFA